MFQMLYLGKDRLIIFRKLTELDEEQVASASMKGNMLKAFLTGMEG